MLSLRVLTVRAAVFATLVVSAAAGAGWKWK